MFDLETLQEFLGWCSVLNIAILCLSSFLTIILRAQVSKIHNRMFDLDEKSLSNLYIKFLANYKMLIIIFNIVPYFALKIMR